MIVDMRMVESATPFHVGDWLQAIGELLIVGEDGSSGDGGGGGGALWLRARICRNVNGLNVALYERALEATREFERELLS